MIRSVIKTATLRDRYCGAGLTPVSMRLAKWMHLRCFSSGVGNGLDRGEMIQRKEVRGNGCGKYKFDPSIVSILVCPISKSPLIYDEKSQSLICEELNVSYPIVDGIPRLVPHDGKIL